jgi:two-component system chemotaxis response regulator CheY
MTKLMLVDDSVTIRRVLKNVLNRMLKDEIEYVEAGDGIEALEALKNNKDIALIFLDVNMPNMNGDVFLEKMRAMKEFNAIRVVMVTTEAEKSNVVRIMKLGANGFIVKPFTPDIVRKSITPILARLGIEV